MTDDRLHRTLEALWRMESPRLVARIARMTGDVGTAEELAQDVLVVALERWPRDGVPDNPAAWLMAAAKHRAIDHLRQRALHAGKQTEYGVELQMQGADMAHDRADEHADDDIGDDLLRLVFVACHPVLPLESRVALTLRLLGGLTTTEIARAFLQPEATVAQRIVRAKRTLADKQIAFEVPRRAELAERLDAVLEVIYLVFNEGYAATAGEDWMRPALCEEALRLGRVLAGLLPREAEVSGLLALMELQASRAKARIAADGSPVLLLEQDRARWDRLQIQRGLQALARAQRIDGARPYALQAAIAACHARAARAEDTDWTRIAALYAVLMRVQPSPVIELNRSVAVGKAQGPAAALPLVDALRDAAQLRDYGLLYAVRGDLLERLGRRDEARVEFERAASLATNPRDRALMQARAGANTAS
jgi:RNA polymerase sigma factor (sigma-70 family)